jgi:hypothetical protein
VSTSSGKKDREVFKRVPLTVEVNSLFVGRGIANGVIGI